MRVEVQQYMRASANLFGLANKTGQLTLAERAAIVAFAQVLERKFLPSLEEGDMLLSETFANLPPID